MYTPYYTITNKILRQIGIIEACKEVIDHAPLLPYYEKKFQDEAIVRTVHYGTHIEGNGLNLNQAERVLQGQNVIARERDIKEIINYRRVMDYISDIQDKSKITDDIIKKMHKITVNKILEDDQCGVYRKTQVVIKNSTTGETSFTPPSAVSVPFQMKEFIAYINRSNQEDIHPVLKSASVHYEFVRIHPFIDGNGRVGRALSTLILFHEGYDIRKFFSLEEFFDTDDNRYYQALQSVAKNNGELTFWLEYFTEGLAIELTKIKERIEGISVDAKLKEKLGGQPMLLSDRQLKIIEYIQKTGYLQNKAFKMLFSMVSEDTVLNELKVLLKAGLIKKQGATKSARYIMS